MLCYFTGHSPIDCHSFPVYYHNKQHEDKLPPTHTCLGTSFGFISLGYNSRSWIAKSKGLCTFNLSSCCQLDFPRGCNTFIPVTGDPSFPCIPPGRLVIRLVSFAQVKRYKVAAHHYFEFAFPPTPTASSRSAPLFICLAIWMHSPVNCLCESFAHLSIGSFVPFLSTCQLLYSIDINPLWAFAEQLFLPEIQHCLLTPFMVSFALQNFRIVI